MIIIIEGPDGAGKTSLAKLLSRQTGYPIEHYLKPKTSEEKERMMGEYLLLVWSNKDIILDRCWYSEMVYGKVMRNKSYIDYQQMYELERILAKNGAIVIYCTGHTSTLWRRCISRGEDYITQREDFEDICDEYNKLMDMPHFVPVVKYEYKEV